MTASAPCLAAFFSISFLLLITVWVTPENQLAELALRGSSVLPQDFRGPQMGVVSQTVGRAQTACISRLTRSTFNNIGYFSGGQVLSETRGARYPGQELVT